ncbi:zinc finger protein AEBP2-like [Panonychus citri]|uniref:zinc finger protein AEBP2-like n=1 Tax=Panonychus citri TaxID=50023 RepID=UPI0023082321|nr:zinc finger protein AEBP2-like [Panonychus citri]
MADQVSYTGPIEFVEALKDKSSTSLVSLDVPLNNMEQRKLCDTILKMVNGVTEDESIEAEEKISMLKKSVYAMQKIVEAKGNGENTVKELVTKIEEKINLQITVTPPMSNTFAEIIKETTYSRPIKLKRKKSKAKRISCYVKPHEDYFDPNIMDIITFELMKISMETGLDILGNQNDIIFHSKVIGRCCPERGASVKYLLHWTPEGIIPDEWVTEDDLEDMSSRRVPLNSLPTSTLLENFVKSQSQPRQRGRK